MERPHLKYIDAGRVAPTPSISAMTAPGRAASEFGDAVGGFGQVLGDIGEKGKELARKIQAEEDGGKASKFFLGVETDVADFNNSILERQDYENLPGEFDERMSAHRARIGELGLSPEGQRRLEARFDEYHTEKGIRLGSVAAASRVSQARGWDAQALKSRQEARDWDGMDRQIDSMVGRYPEHEIERLRSERQRLERHYNLEERATDFPQEFLEDPRPDDIDAGAWENLRLVATRKITRTTATEMDKAADLMAERKLVDPAKVDEWFPNLRPAAKEELKAAVIRRADVNADAFRRSPDEQNRIAGDVAAKIGAYQPSGEEFDADYVKIATGIAELEPGPLKDEFQGQLKALRDGARQVIDDNSKAAFKQLDDLFAAEAKASIQRQNTAAAVDHGLLTDTAKLSEAGFSEDQVKALADKELSRTARIQLFRQEWWKRPGSASGTITPYTMAAFEAVVDGKTEISLDDPEAEAAHQKAHGAARLELAEYLKANPKASAEAITGKLHSIGISTKAETLKSSITKPRPGGTVNGGALPKNLAPLQSAFDTYGRQYGVDPRFLAAIARFETADGTSHAFRSKNNAMGASNDSGPLTFRTKEASIERMARTLANPDGPYAGASTLQEIAAIYSPVGAKNDFKKTNHHWPVQVAKLLKQMGVDPATTPLIQR